MGNTTNSGIGFMGLLQVVFITLKLIGHIDWSWWWVLSPIILNGLFILFFIGMLLILKLNEYR